MVSAKPLDSLRLELKQGKKFIVYRVLKGEKIEDIASKYETEESTLLSMNPLIQTEVKPGQIIKIPLNIEKYGDVSIPEVKPIEYMALPLASFLPPPSQKQLPSKQLMTTTEAIPAEVKAPLNNPVQVAAKPKSDEPVILGEPVALPKKEPEIIVPPTIVQAQKPIETPKINVVTNTPIPKETKPEPTISNEPLKAPIQSTAPQLTNIPVVKPNEVKELPKPVVQANPVVAVTEQNKSDENASEPKQEKIKRIEAVPVAELNNKDIAALKLKPTQLKSLSFSKTNVMPRKSGGFRAKLQQELDEKEMMALQVQTPVKAPIQTPQVQTLTQQPSPELAQTPQIVEQPKPAASISQRDTVAMQLLDKALVNQAPKLAAKPINTESTGPKPKKLVKNSVISGRTTDKLIPKENQVAADYITDVYDKKGDIKIAQDLSILKDTIDKNEEKALQIYVVTEPQTVKKLAAILKIDPKLIYDANDFSSPNLWPGQKIWIPEGAAAIETTISHLNDSQKAQKAKRNSNLNQIIREDNDEQGFSAVDLETDSFVVKNEPKELIAEAETELVADSTEYRPDLDKLHLGVGVQTSQHVFVNREVDTTIAKHYGDIGEVGVRILNDFSFYDDNAITYSAIDFREQHLAVDEWAVTAADSNSLYIRKDVSKQGPGDRQFTHVVKDGETLLSIAKKYDVTQSDLANWNNLMKYRLRIGQELIVNQNRGKLSYYERAIEPKQNKTVLPVYLTDNKHMGLAYYNPSAQLKGVLMNNVPVGKWILIHNDDKFKKRAVQVLGPLPSNAPKDCLLMIDKYTALNLEIKNITSRVSVNIAEIK